MQIDPFHLRERDLLRRFVAEVSQYQTEGETEESAFILVRNLSWFVYHYTHPIFYCLNKNLKLFSVPELSAF